MTIDRRTLLKGTAATGALLAAPFVTTSATFGQTVKVRTDLQSMQPTDRFFTDYADAISAMHSLPASDHRNWRNQALIHLNHCPHGMIGFFPWHRWYIHFYEEICATLIDRPDFTLPYWNWAAKSGSIPLPFYSVAPAPTAGLNVRYWSDPSNAQSNNWGPDTVVTVGVRSLCEGTGLQDTVAGVFDQQAIDSYQAQSNFTDFWHAIEGQPHNTGHVISGGSFGHMGDGMSPLDPIFWLHHCNVDRMWAEWQKAGNTTPDLTFDYSGQFVDGSGAAQTRIVANASYDTTKLGYVYDTTETSAPKGLMAGAASLRDVAVSQPRVLASTDVAQSLSIGSAASIQVTNAPVLDSLFSRRVFNATNFLATPRKAVESGRVIARLIDVGNDGPANTMMLRVFVNAPDATSATPTSDPRYAGTVSFFGNQAHHGGGRTFVVDITEPLRNLANDGGVSDESLSIQVVPAATSRLLNATTLSIGKVEIVSA